LQAIFGNFEVPSSTVKDFDKYSKQETLCLFCLVDNYITKFNTVCVLLLHSPLFNSFIHVNTAMNEKQ